MRKLLICLCILLLLGVRCSSSKNNFYSRKYPTENSRSYHEKTGLMILNSTYLGKNKEFNSKHNTQARFKKYKRNNRFKKYKKINRTW